MSPSASGARGASPSRRAAPAPSRAAARPRSGRARRRASSAVGLAALALGQLGRTDPRLRLRRRAAPGRSCRLRTPRSAGRSPRAATTSRPGPATSASGDEDGEAAAERLARGAPPHARRRPGAPAGSGCRRSPAIGSDHREDRDRPGQRPASTSPSPQAGAEQRRSARPALAQAVPSDARQRDHHAGTARTPAAAPRPAPRAVTTARAQGLRRGRSRVPPAPRQHAEQRGLDPVEQVGDAGEVGEHVVAVEADQRRQLAHHLQDLGRHHEQQRVVPGRPPDADDADRDDRVEVEPAEVGADAGRRGRAGRSR